eukprot:790930-Pyramimonas_sp.AAC.1
MRSKSSPAFRGFPRRGSSSYNSLSIGLPTTCGWGINDISPSVAGIMASGSAGASAASWATSAG